MNELEAYLSHYYITAKQLAEVCSISVDELDSLVRDKLVPQPSYIVTDDGIFVSQAFGEFSAPGMSPGNYFHPGNAVWVNAALEVRKENNAQQAHVLLKQQFKNNFALALADLNETTLRMTDSFSDDGKIIYAGLQTRTEDAWNAFVNGVFSLCVADPTTERSIAKKEILQEVLTKLSDNGAKENFTQPEIQRIRNLIEQYTETAMPFSPVEYPTSSRKRLVDDLNARINAYQFNK